MATTMQMKITPIQTTKDVTPASDPFQDALRDINERFEQDYQRLAQTKPTVQVLDINGSPVYIKHCAKKGRDWVNIMSPALMCNPEFDHLRRRAYDEKAALFAAYRA